MLSRQITSKLIWCTVLALVLGLVGIRFSVSVPGTQAQGNSFVFTAHGDHGAYNDPDTLASLRAVAGTGAAFSLALGDMNYESVGTEQRWCQTVQGILGSAHPFELLMGNHEDESKANGYIGNFIKYCPDRMNAQGIYGAEYFFDYPATNPLMRVIMIGAGNDWDWDGSGGLEADEYFDYDSTTAARKAHLDWLVNKIDTARSAGIPWVIVGTHKNCLTIGEKSCEIGPELLNVLVAKRVDLILQGHDHTYQRSRQLSLGTGCSSIAVGSYDPDCVADSGADGVFTKGAGPILVVAGHFGGGGFYSVSSSDPESGYFARAMGGNGWYDFLQNTTLHTPSSRGFVKITVSDSQIVVEHVATTNLSTGFSDVFSIVTGGTPAPSPTSVRTSVPTSAPTSAPTTTPGATPVPSGSLVFTPTDDATIRADYPTTNYGTNATLETDGSPAKESLLRFSVSGIGTRTVARATLRLFNVDASSSGGDIVAMTGTNWSESTVTWNTAPTGDGRLLASLGSVTNGLWYEIDVTSLVTRDGVFSVRLRSSNTNGADYSSSEDASGNTPQLVVQLSSPPLSNTNPTPVPTSTVVVPPTIAPSATARPPATALPGGSAATVRLVPVADGYVYSSKPTAHYGSTSVLRIDGSPDTRSYLKFDVQGVSGPITRAVLRVYANSASSAGYNVARVADSGWGESTLTYQTAPAVGTASGTSGRFTSGSWTTVDVTALVAANGPLTLAMMPIDTRAVSFSSREDMNAPELVITYGSQATATLVPTRTPLPTATLTPLPTQTPRPTLAPTAAPTSAPTATLTAAPTQTPSGGSNTGFQPQAPYYATFFYLWYQQPNPNGAWSYWNDHGNQPPQTWFSHYLPDYRTDIVDPASELYSSVNYDVFKWQVSKLAEARQEVAIASWWGQGRKEDAALQTIVNTYMFRADNPYPNLRWSIYYEPEAYADESVDALVGNLRYIQSTLAGSASYLKVNGKPVIFVYAGPNDTPGTMTQRWKQANAQMGNAFYIVLKVFSGYRTDPNQPDSWHQYAPAERGGIHGNYSAFVSPGFWLDDGSAQPRLARNLSEFETAVIAMVNADVTWKLVETWNEWGEGTSVEPGHQVIETAGKAAILDLNGPQFGNAYVDILNAHLPPLEGASAAPAAAYAQMAAPMLSVDAAVVTEATPTPALATPTATATATAPVLADLQIVESDDANVQQTGAWTTHETEIASGGRYVFSSGDPGDALTVTFAGTRAEVIYVAHPSLGTLGIEVDGVLLGQVSSTAPDSQFGVRTTIGPLFPGQHLLRVYPLAGTIAIDAFAVETLVAPSSVEAPALTPTVLASPAPITALPAETQVMQPVSTAPDNTSPWMESDQPSVLRAGDWTLYASGQASGGAYLFSNSSGDSLAVAFSGTQVDVIYVKHPALGAFGIEIDGALVQAVDSTAADSVFGARASVTGLPDGPHMLRVYPLTGTIAIDAFALQPATSPVPTPAQATALPDGATASPLEATPFASAPVSVGTPTSTPLPVLLPYLDPFDSGQGWTASGAWRLETQTAISGAGWFADGTRRALTSTLTADRLINLRGALNPELSFWQKAALTPTDVLTVEVSFDDGLSWVRVSEQTGASHGWTQRTLDLSPYQGYVIRLRYRLDTIGSLPATTAITGVWIDQLAVQDRPPATPGVPTLDASTLAAPATSMPTATPIPTSTPTETATELPTSTPAPTVTPTEAATELPTSVPAPTATPTDTAPELPTNAPAPTGTPAAIPTEPPVDPSAATPSAGA